MRNCFQLFLGLVLLLASLLAQASGIAQHLDALKSQQNDEKIQAIQAIGESGDEQALGVLGYLLDGKLFVIEDTGQVVYAMQTEGREWTVYSAADKAEVGIFKKSALQKIRVNNSLRGEIRGAMASLQLASKDPLVRLEAIKNLRANLDPSMAPMLKKALGKEDSGKVQTALEVTLALVAFNQVDDFHARLVALDTLKDSDDPVVLVALNSVLSGFPEGKLSDEDGKLKAGVTSAIKAIDGRKQVYGVLENLFFGLSLGSVLLLAAIGLAITFGVMGVINMAHGEMMMLGAYTTFVIQTALPQYIDYSLAIAIPAAFLVAAIVGILIERTVIRHLYGRPLETLLATFGISLILQQAVRSIFSPLNQSVANPAWMSGTLEITESFGLTYNRLYIIVFSLIVFVLLMVLLKRSLFGLQMRAVTQNRRMANSMGIRSGWVDALTFGLGSGIAGIAGVALSQVTNVGPNLGQNYIIDSFMVVVFGGVGNLWGTLVAAMGLGVINKIIEPWAGAVLSKIIVLVGIILFIQRRPRGLFALKGRAVEG